MYVNNNAGLPLRMVTYSQDGLGLGHMRRTHSIVSTFLQAHPDASVLTLSDSQLGQFFWTCVPLVFPRFPAHPS